MPEHCERCGCFIGESCMEGWFGGLFGDYNGLYYCAYGKGCNRTEEEDNNLTEVLDGGTSGS